MDFKTFDEIIIEKLKKDLRYQENQKKIDEINNTLKPICVSDYQKIETNFGEFSSPKASYFGRIKNNTDPFKKFKVHDFYEDYYLQWVNDVEYFYSHRLARKKYSQDYLLKKVLIYKAEKLGIKKIQNLINEGYDLINDQIIIEKNLIYNILLENIKNPEFHALLKDISYGRITMEDTKDAKYGIFIMKELLYLIKHSNKMEEYLNKKINNVNDTFYEYDY